MSRFLDAAAAVWQALAPVEQVLALAAGLLGFGFALLMWTPLGDKASPRSFLPIAVIGHLLLIGAFVGRGQRNDFGPATATPWLGPAAGDTLDASLDFGAGPEPGMKSPAAELRKLLEPRTPVLPKNSSEPRTETLASLDKPTEPELKLPAAELPRAELRSDETLAAAPASKARAEELPAAAARPVAKAAPPERTLPKLAPERREELAAAPVPRAEAMELPRAKFDPVPLADDDGELVKSTPKSAGKLAALDQPAAAPPPPPAPQRLKSAGPGELAMATPRTPTPLGNAAGGMPAAVPALQPKAVGPEGDLAARRAGANRQRLLERFGGNAKTEAAVDSALEWLAAHQSADGRWAGAGFSKRCPDGDQCEGPAVEAGSDVGVTALAALAFLGAGHTHLDEKSKRHETVRRALNWLLKEQLPDGDLMGRNRQGRVYSHAIATLALCEALQMTGDERLRAPCQRAVEWLARGQHPELGGWRYAPGIDSDTSVFGWCVLALASGRQAGLTIPDDTFANARGWLRKASAGTRGGLAKYQPNYEPSPAMTAEALACRHALGVADADAADEAIAYLLQRTPRAGDPQIYLWYYGTVALFHSGDAAWERWNHALQAALLPTQRLDGHARGSWDPHAPFGVDGGRVFATAASALCLEVYYRHLPLYNDRSARP